jgi:hypothetical protein
MAIIKIPTNYYQHFDADFNKDVPGEGYGGWKKALLPLDTEKTALAVMHAWDCGTREQYPGWHRAVEYIPRAYEILRTEFPKILNAVRQANMNIVHIASGEEYCKDYPGYKITKGLVKKHIREEHKQNSIHSEDEVLKELHRFRHANVFPGEHNVADIKAGQSKMTFAKEAEPMNDEAIVKDSTQLFAYCIENKINHLIYIGFAIDGCLLISPGGMVDISRKGILCSTIRQAVTAIENKETAREEICKQVALWRVALLYGFVYDSDDFVKGLLSLREGIK